MARTIRLSLSGYPAEGLRDADTGDFPPVIWEGNAFDLHLYLGSPCAQTVLDLSLITSLTVNVRDSTGTILFTKTTTTFTVATRGAWLDITGYHAAFSFTNEEATFVAGTPLIWMDFQAVMTNGDHTTLGAGFVAILSGTTPSGAAANANFTLTVSGTPSTGYVATITPATGVPFQFSVIPAS